MSNVASLESKLNNLADLLEIHLPLVEAHNTEFFAEGYWDKYVPDNFKKDLASLSSDKLSNLLTECSTTISNNHTSISDSINNLESFLSIVRRHTLPNLNILTELQKLFNDYSGKPNVAKVSSFMTDKKFHETYEMSEIISCICQYHNVSYVIDIGSGRGYLSNFLTLNCRLNVLGLEGNENINESASHREIKLNKYWDGLKTKATKKTNQKNSSNERENYGLFQRKTCYVTPDLDIDALLREKFSAEINDAAVIGLHTCGSLANSLIELFLRRNSIGLLVNVACCYQHILPEEFPLSSPLKKRNFYLNRFVTFNFKK